VDILYIVATAVRIFDSNSEFSNIYLRRFFTLATMPSNQQTQQTLSHLLAHCGPPNSETPTTETTTVRWHKNCGDRR